MAPRMLQRGLRTARSLKFLSLVTVVVLVLTTSALFRQRQQPDAEMAGSYRLQLPSAALSRTLHGAGELLAGAAPTSRTTAHDQVKEIDLRPAKTAPSLLGLAAVNNNNNNNSSNNKHTTTAKSEVTTERPPPSLIGRINPEITPMEIPKIVAMFPFMKNGRFLPDNFQSLEKVAILIPYRNRRKHLYTLLPVLIPLLMRQRLEFGIFVFELDPPTTFNKGSLFNAGFREIMSRGDYTCVILHDVDLLPLDDRNLYRCDKDHPIHFSANIVEFKSFYNGLFGGVVGFTPDQFRTINGASNLYFGWGGEDDDLRDRALGKNFTILRKPYKHAVYKMIYHTKRGYWKPNGNRFRIFASRRERVDFDGLNSLDYTVTRVRDLKVCTWINIGVNATQIVDKMPKELTRFRQEELQIDVDTGIINLED